MFLAGNTVSEATTTATKTRKLAQITKAAANKTHVRGGGELPEI